MEFPKCSWVNWDIRIRTSFSFSSETAAAPVASSGHIDQFVSGNQDQCSCNKIHQCFRDVPSDSVFSSSNIL